MESLILYISLFLLSGFSIYIECNQKKKIYIFIGLLIPILLSSFRFEVGTDYYSYIEYFYYPAFNKNIFDFKTKEYGFFLISKLSTYLNDSRYMFFISSLVTVFFTYFSIKNYSNKKAWLGFILYLFLLFPQSFNIVRQSIAISIVWFSYKYIYQRNLKKYTFFIFLASLFHKSAFFMEILYFLYPIIYAKKYRILKKMIICIGVFLCFLFAIQGEKIIRLVSEFSFFNSYSIYVTDHIGVGKNKEFYLKCIFSLIFFIFRKKLISRNKKNEFLIFTNFINLIVISIGFFNVFLKRVGMYLELSWILLFIEISKLFIGKFNKIIINIIIILYSIFFFILMFYFLEFANIFPYKLCI